MFSNDMKGTGQDRIVLNGFSSDLFEKVMCVLYKGGFAPENFAEVYNTYMCPDFYQLDCVKNLF